MNWVDCIRKMCLAVHIFLASTAAQEAHLSVCLSVHLCVPSLKLHLALAILLTIANFASFSNFACFANFASFTSFARFASFASFATFVSFARSFASYCNLLVVGGAIQVVVQ